MLVDYFKTCPLVTIKPYYLTECFHAFQQFSDGPPPAWMSSYEMALANLSECGGGGEGADNEWTKPKAETDKLFMSVGGNTIIEVGHPPPKKDDLDMR